ncbi:hypothetical protein B0J11DRAFT_508190 [Dendryphion nanum]|uniref:Uncharacterized protein n=1 Tax=Dendryphion nanum TaxID=256645 RepID=A0A9P9DMB1_9PLEO|nr:hypothetical protein B0J11DRAFT_508190 [Dendryphion nanum]
MSNDTGSPFSYDRARAGGLSSTAGGGGNTSIGPRGGAGVERWAKAGERAKVGGGSEEVKRRQGGGRAWRVWCWPGRSVGRRGIVSTASTVRSSGSGGGDSANSHFVPSGGQHRVILGRNDRDSPGRPWQSPGKPWEALEGLQSPARGDDRSAKSGHWRAVGPCKSAPLERAWLLQRLPDNGGGQEWRIWGPTPIVGTLAVAVIIRTTVAAAEQSVGCKKRPPGQKQKKKEKKKRRKEDHGKMAHSIMLAFVSLSGHANRETPFTAQVVQYLHCIDAAFTHTKPPPSPPSAVTFPWAVGYETSVT